MAIDLKPGMKVRVTWSGGNGPHIYKVREDKWGNLTIETERCFVEYADSLEFRAAKVEVIE